MPNISKPRIGLLGLILDAYEPIFDGITARQEHFLQQIAESLRPEIEVYCPGAKSTRQQIENAVIDMNQRNLDGLLIVMLTYNCSTRLIPSLKTNQLPLALAVVQPDPVVRDEWVELDLTVNQGIHGAQDNANALLRSGHRCQYFAGNRHETRFHDFVVDFGKAAQTCRALRRMKVAVWGRLSGMGDLLTDEFAFYRTIGPEFVHVTVGQIHHAMEKVADAEIQAQLALDRRRFEIDPSISEENLAYAERMYLGLKQYLQENGFDAFTVQFDIFAEDGRFRQIPFLAASHLMADGYGYAAEGDMTCAALLAAAHRLGGGDGTFSEMYAMDADTKSILFCHAGEGNWDVANPERKPRLIDHYVGEGGLGNMPTPVFTVRPGPATVASLVSLEGSHFRLVLAGGEILPRAGMTGNEMPYFFFRPQGGVESCVEGWLRSGGTHHEVINASDLVARWRMLCEMIGIELVQVS